MLLSKTQLRNIFTTSFAVKPYQNTLKYGNYNHIVAWCNQNRLQTPSAAYCSRRSSCAWQYLMQLPTYAHLLRVWLNAGQWLSFADSHSNDKPA
jgi:hypothetical protein